MDGSRTQELIGGMMNLMMNNHFKHFFIFSIGVGGLLLLSLEYKTTYTSSIFIYYIAFGLGEYFKDVIGLTIQWHFLWHVSIVL